MDRLDPRRFLDKSQYTIVIVNGRPPLYPENSLAEELRQEGYRIREVAGPKIASLPPPGGCTTPLKGNEFESIRTVLAYFDALLLKETTMDHLIANYRQDSPRVYDLVSLLGGEGFILAPLKQASTPIASDLVKESIEFGRATGPIMINCGSGELFDIFQREGLSILQMEYNGLFDIAEHLMRQPTNQELRAQFREGLHRVYLGLSPSIHRRGLEATLSQARDCVRYCHNIFFKEDL